MARRHVAIDNDGCCVAGTGGGGRCHKWCILVRSSEILSSHLYPYNITIPNVERKYCKIQRNIQGKYLIVRRDRNLDGRWADKIHRKYIDKIQRKYLVEVGQLHWDVLYGMIEATSGLGIRGLVYV